VIACDAEGQVFVSGQSVSTSSGADIVTIKYSAAGDELWLRTFAGPELSKEAPQALAVDDLGSAYVVGESAGAIVVIKYSADGDPLWVRYSDEAGTDAAVAAAWDSQGYLLVTGKSSMATSSPEDFDIVTVKYRADGAEVWTRRYSGTDGGQDTPSGLALDGEGSVYIVGQSDRHATYPFDPDILLLKYDSYGNLVWSETYGGVTGGWDRGEAVCVDDSGYVYVAGSSESGVNYSDFVVIKYRQNPCLCGDADGNGIFNVSDASYLIGYIFGSGPAPTPLCLGDADGNCGVSVSDAVLMIGYIFADGPPPGCSPNPCDWR
jgi:hypothetical protein